MTFTEEQVYMLIMKHYHMSIVEVKSLTKFDQKLMLRAIFEEIEPSGKQLYFETEKDYQRWLSEQRRNRQTSRRSAPAR